MALNDVTAEWAAGGRWEFEIDFGARSQRPERGAVERFLSEIGVEVSWVHIERGETDAGDAQRIAFAQARGYSGRFDSDAASAACFLEADQSAGPFDDAGEHISILQIAEIEHRAGYFADRNRRISCITRSPWSVWKRYWACAEPSRTINSFGCGAFSYCARIPGSRS